MAYDLHGMLDTNPLVILTSIGTAVLVYFWFKTDTRRVKPTPSTHSLDKQSIEVEGTDGARRCALTDQTITRLHDNVDTIYDAFLRGVRISGDSPCLGTRQPPLNKYEWLTYNEIHTRSYHVGCGLVNLGCQPSQNTYVGIFAPNCTEWFLADIGCQMFSMVTVPLYESHGLDACVHIINEAHLTTIVCHASKVNFILQSMEHCKVVKRIVKIGSPVTEEENSAAKESGVKLITFKDLEVIGSTSPCQKNAPKPDDIFTICYTSGTTGTPKGAMITHDNVVSDLAAFHFVTEQFGLSLNEHEVLLSYLPLAHMYERINQISIYTVGGRIGFFSGDIKLLLNDLKELKPTVFPTVPRLLNRIYDKVTNEISKSKLKSWLFEKALAAKQRDLDRKIIRNDTWWDVVVFRKVQNILGGRVRFILSGSAPLSSKVATFMRCVMGCPVQEGYGQTEATASTAVQLLDDFSVGHVGPPVPVNIIKLIDVKEKDYYAKNNQGEICVKGRNVFKGYLNNPEKTDEVIDADGWLKSGDIGEWTKNGTLKIIDRKNNIFKLSQGEFIAPEKIENIYLRSPFLAQIFVFGEPTKSFLVAIAVPDADVLEKWTRENGIMGSLAELCKNKTVMKAVLQNCIEKGEEGKLNRLEKIKSIHLHPEPFSIENKLLTPTLKQKRPAMAKFFRKEIDSLYESTP